MPIAIGPLPWAFSLRETVARRNGVDRIRARDRGRPSGSVSERIPCLTEGAGE